MRRRVTPEELADFYRRIGAAIWQIQYLEDALVSFLTLTVIHERRCAGKEVGVQDADLLLAEKRRMTFGPLLESALRRKVVRREHQAEFERFKQERHWLVHRSLIDNGDDLYLDSTRTPVFERVATIKTEAVRLRDLVAADLESWCVAKGIDAKEVHQQAEAAIRRLAGA